MKAERSHHLRVEGDLLGQTDAVTDLKASRHEPSNSSWVPGPLKTTCPRCPPGSNMSHTHNLLSFVVGLKDVADCAIVALGGARLQNKPKEPLVVLVGGALVDGGQRELQEDRTSSETQLPHHQSPSNRGRLTLRRVT